jgi:DnaJ family protein C protein 3
LKLDPDDKQCQPHYKKVKKLVKQMNAAQEAKVNGQYDECLNKAKQFMKTEPDEEFYQLKGQSYLCHCYSKVLVRYMCGWSLKQGWICINSGM